MSNVPDGGSADHEFYSATLRMARLYYDRYPDTLDWANADGKTALHIAAMRGKEELVRVCPRIYSSLYCGLSDLLRCCVISGPTLIFQTTRGIRHYTSE